MEVLISLVINIIFNIICKVFLKYTDTIYVSLVNIQVRNFMKYFINLLLVLLPGGFIVLSFMIVFNFLKKRGLK